MYVFAVTQVSHELLHHLNLGGLVETLVLWFAVWLGWQYTCWFTNWFDPEQPRIRGLLFACSYAALQVGRTGFIVLELGRHPPAM